MQARSSKCLPGRLSAEQAATAKAAAAKAADAGATATATAAAPPAGGSVARTPTELAKTPPGSSAAAATAAAAAAVAVEAVVQGVLYLYPLSIKRLTVSAVCTPRLVQSLLSQKAKLDDIFDNGQGKQGFVV